MKCPWWTPEVDDLLVRAKEMAGTEPEFAKRVFEDADAAVKDRFGVELTVKVKLVWLNDNALGLLPAETPLEPGDELSDELRGLVSAGAVGGTTGPNHTTC
jgi:hypothetical protein